MMLDILQKWAFSIHFQVLWSFTFRGPAAVGGGSEAQRAEARASGRAAAAATHPGAKWKSGQMKFLVHFFVGLKYLKLEKFEI